VAYSGSITHSSSGAETKNISVSGTGAGAPEIVVSTASIPSFGEVLIGSNSGVKSYTVSGKNLTGNITLSAPSGFQISTNNSTGFGNSLTLTQNSGIVGSTTVYARFSPTAAAVYTGNITHTSSGAETKNVSVSGIGITNDPAILTISNVNGKAGSSVTVPVLAKNLKEMSAFQFTIQYDKNRLVFVNCSNWAAGITGVVVATPQEGIITLVFADPNAIINIPDGKFFDLNFTIKNGVTGIAEIIWSDNPLQKSIVNKNLLNITCTYINGSVAIVTGYKTFRHFYIR
jgi:hypothetical protein